MKTYGDIALDAYNKRWEIKKSGSMTYGDAFDIVAAAVIAEYERRTFEVVWLVKFDNGTYLGWNCDTVARQSKAHPFSDQFFAERSAYDQAGKVVRIRRRRKP